MTIRSSEINSNIGDQQQVDAVISDFRTNGFKTIFNFKRAAEPDYFNVRFRLLHLIGETMSSDERAELSDAITESCDQACGDMNAKVEVIIPGKVKSGVTGLTIPITSSPHPPVVMNSDGVDDSPTSDDDTIDNGDISNGSMGSIGDSISAVRDKTNLILYSLNDIDGTRWESTEKSGFTQRVKQCQHLLRLFTNSRRISLLGNDFELDMVKFTANFKHII